MVFTLHSCYCFENESYRMLHFKSPQVSSTSRSSSEADDEDADGESSGEPPGAPKQEEAIGNGNPKTEESNVNTPPPSYPAQQVGSSVSCFSVFPKISSLVYVFYKTTDFSAFCHK